MKSYSYNQAVQRVQRNQYKYGIDGAIEDAIYYHILNQNEQVSLINKFNSSISTIEDSIVQEVAKSIHQ